MQEMLKWPWEKVQKGKEEEVEKLKDDKSRTVEDFLKTFWLLDFLRKVSQLSSCVDPESAEPLASFDLQPFRRL